MHPSKLKPGTVLAKLTNLERRKIFETEVENIEGKISSLITSLHAEPVEDEWYSQVVQVAEIIGVAANVDHIKIGDRVIVDYLADTDEKRIAFIENGEKLVSLDADTKYHTDDMIAFASMRSRMDTYTWRKGDVESQSWIYAIYRNDLIIPNNDYILIEHRDLTWEGKTKGGITFYDTEGDVVVRKVIAAPVNSSVKKGDMIVVEAMVLFERSIGKFNFDIIMDNDLLATLV